MENDRINNEIEANTEQTSKLKNNIDSIKKVKYRHENLFENGRSASGNKAFEAYDMALQLKRIGSEEQKIKKATKTLDSFKKETEKKKKSIKN